MARTRSAVAQTGRPHVRCAIYTRKSTEDGLEQEFNSLDAQREACAAYVLSQRHEGWTLLPDSYDDGGFSGGSMERPGLKRLLAEVEAGRVDVIVVYKVDRLTRSLADFAKIVEVLDAKGASFVSVTQAFNTTTSMGRLTLNVLLSFAQFEREVTGERIRDKIAASKKKGLWMGGPVPLGYDVQDRKLVVNEPEADLVRHILQRYLSLPSVNALADELNREGHRTKVQQRVSGPHRGGIAFRRGTLYHLLANRIYLGEIVHKGQHYPGEHPAIVPNDLWEQVQAKLGEQTSGPSRRLKVRHPSPLAGRLVDGHDRPMAPSHATKGQRRYRYYITRPDLQGAEPAWRVRADDLERLVIEQLAGLLNDRSHIAGIASRAHADAAGTQLALHRAAAAALTLAGGLQRERIVVLKQLVQQVALQEGCTTVAIDMAALLDLFGQNPSATTAPIDLVCPTVRVRQGHDIRLVIPGAAEASSSAPRRDEKLIGLLAEAQAARDLIFGHPDRSLHRIAADAGRCRTRLGRLFQLSHLAPAIIVAIMEGKQPDGLTPKRLLEIDLPIDWDAQRAVLGIG